MKKLQIDYKFLGYTFPYQKLFHVLSSSSLIKFFLISTLFVRKRKCKVVQVTLEIESFKKNLVLNKMKSSRRI